MNYRLYDLSVLSDLSDKFYDIESVLRDIVTGLQLGEISKEDVLIRLRGLEDEFYEFKRLHRIEEGTNPLYEHEEVTPALHMACDVDRIFDYLIRALSSGKEVDISKLREFAKSLNKEYQELREKLLPEELKKNMPIRCVGSFVDTDKYNLNLFLNDVAACVHQTGLILHEFTAEKLGTKVKPISYDKTVIYLPKRLANKASIVRDYIDYGTYHPELDRPPLRDIVRNAELCVVWEQEIHKLYDNVEDAMLPVDENDFEALQCIASDRGVEIRTGSAPVHLAKIDPDKLKVEYYDEDDRVREIMKDLLEDFTGAKCADMPLLNKLECTVDNTSSLKDVARVLAYATSMDLRLSRYATPYSDVIKEIAKRAYEEKIPEYEDVLDTVLNDIEEEFISTIDSKTKVEKIIDYSLLAYTS